MRFFQFSLQTPRNFGELSLLRAITDQPCIERVLSLKMFLYKNKIKFFLNDMKIKVALLTTLQAAIKWNGSVYNKLQLKSSKQAKASVTLAWKKPSGTKKVVIYGNKRGKANKMKKIGTYTGKSKTLTKVAGKKLKLKKYRAVKYESSNKKVATVTSRGTIKGIKKGITYVCAYAQNGVYKRIQVTVK